jgi:hypothetical protein
MFAALLALSAVPPAAAQEKRMDDRRMERTVSVSASGFVSAEPDIAHISTGVVSEAATAREALTLNTASMKKVVDGLKGAGVAAKDIQTVSFNVEPRYQHFKDGKPPVINGYRVVNSVRITARDLAKFGDVLDAVVTLGANQIGAIQFEVTKAEALKDDARKNAMENALRRAKLYATAAGAEVGPVLSISEEIFAPQPRPVPMARAAMSAEAVPIERGSQTLEVKVHVTWGLK